MDKTLVVSALVSEESVKGSIKMPCAHCLRNVWASPSTQEFMKTTEVEIICIDCALPFLCEDKSIDLIPGQLEELKEHLG